MKQAASNREAMLDWLFGIALLGALLSGLHYVGVAPLWMTGMLLGSAVGCLALWIPLRRSRRCAVALGRSPGGAQDARRHSVPDPALDSAPDPARTTSLAFAVCAALAWYAANSPAGLGMLWCGAFAVARAFGGLGVAVFAGGVTLVGTGVHVVSGTEWSQVVVEAVGGALISGIGAVFALLLARSESAEAALRTANDELRRRSALEQDLVLARERERTARALHDGLGHRLTAIGLSLEFAGRARERDPEAAWREVAVAGETAGIALADMRRLVRAMHPVEIGSLSGLESFAVISEVFRKTGLDIRVSVHDDDSDIPQDQLLLLTRTIQEGLTNVVRHSEAARVDIAVRVSERRIEAVVEDDGGPPADGADPVPGFGLRSLIERAEELAGTCAARHGDAGFRLELSLPRHPGAAR